MAFIGILLALGTVAILGYTGYVFLQERRTSSHPGSQLMPFLPKLAADDVDEPVGIDQQNRIFEAYIADKFDREEYRLLHWRRDKKLRKSPVTEGPALTFQLSDNSSIQFSIESSYSPAFTNTNAIGISPGQVDAYYTYQQDSNHPVFVIFGVGGAPEKPERLYVVPLNDIPRKQEFLPASYLSRYRKLDIKSNFFLLPERMLLI